MASNDKRTIYKTLDNSLRVLFWSIDEFLIMMTPIFLGMCSGSLIIMCLGFLLKPIYKRFKKKYPNNSFKHWLYWYLPTTAFVKFGILKKIPPSHQRELLL